MPEARKMTATKAHVPGLGVLVAALLYQFLGVGEMPAPDEFRDAVMAVVNAIGAGAATWLLAYFAPRNAIKMMLPLVAVLLVTACGTVSIGESELTPAERCVGYNAAIMRYERILADEGALNTAQRAAYDFALAGKAATCVQAE